MAAADQAIALQEIRQRLQAYQFRELFDDLGWDHLQGVEPVAVDETEYELERIAHKRGLQVFRHTAPTGEPMPGRSARRKIDREISKLAQEHLLIFTNAAETTQLWQWARREPGKPLQHHEHELQRGQPGEALAQRVQRLYISIADEESLTIPDVVGRVRGGFDAERITRRFYDRFKQEHDAFRGFIEGIATEADRDWYASLMLNRLMFIYFIQKKGFLNHDQNYLRTKLAEVQAQRGSGQFLSFYRHFLLRLFHQGLSQQESERAADLDALLGDVPYLNGGLFDVHTLEAAYANIDLPDEAFGRLFDFFDAYRWHLDERPLRQDNEINPDVLGYIFEKYINQKQMGAYYTKEDITGYISRNTIIPALFDMARKDVAIAFRPGSAMWRLLQENPDRYIYPAMQKGTDLALPADIAAGVGSVAERGGWNRPASEGFALPTETWREHVARRQRHDDIWQRLVDGEIHEIDDLITLNLDIHQFAVDVIAECEGPETLRAFWNAVSRMSVLDPTCGSGAFLFAALNILQPLAEACLERMQAFVDEDDAGDAGIGGRTHSPRFPDFRQTLASVAEHENRAYFVIKQIVLNNLYGVDIMEEAVEICKLRLFLKLVSQVETAERIDPLPDIDFNIRAGNTLVGFATLEEVGTSLGVARVSDSVGQMRMLEPETSSELQAMREEAEKAAKAFSRFREMQESAGDSRALHAAKRDVRNRLTALSEQLNRLLARTYGVEPTGAAFEAWRQSHEPFHWVCEFYDIVHNRSGFSVIVGNPPYLEVSKLRNAYRPIQLETIRCRDIYAWVFERSVELKSHDGRVGLIVPVSVGASRSFQPLRDVVSRTSSTVWLSNFANRPGQLFTGAQTRLSIVLVGSNSARSQFYSTRYHRWDGEAGRSVLFDSMMYARLPTDFPVFHGLWPKVGVRDAISILQKSILRQALSDSLEAGSSNKVFWVRVPGYFCQFFLAPPMTRPEAGGPARIRGEVNSIAFESAELRNTAHALLNSSTYYHFFSVFTDGRHINPADVNDFPMSACRLLTKAGEALGPLSRKLDGCMKANTRQVRKSGLLIDSVDSKSCKTAIDAIDRVLAKHLEFTDEELDFIINYDYKYRMGVDDAEA